MNGVVGVIVSAVVVLVVALVGWFAFVSPQRSKADRLSGEVDSAKSTLSSDQTLLATARRENTEGQAQAAKRALPEQAQVSNILRQLAGFAKESRTELDNITPGAAVSVGSAQAIPISLQFKGRYFGLQKLLKLLNESAVVKDGKIVATGRLYSVSSIQFTGGQAPAGGQASTNDLAATISLNAYLYDSAAAAAAAAAAATSTDSTQTAAAPTQ
jgi:Tfp pilus assembly protein PilO